MKPVEHYVVQFRDAMSAGWPVAKQVSYDLGVNGAYWLDSWKQSQWEFFVEMPLFWRSDRFLVPYDAGADLDGAASRVHRPDTAATHEVQCIVAKGTIDLLTGDKVIIEGKEVTFTRFTSFKDGWHQEAPPFDCVLLEIDGQESLVPFETTRWAVVELT